MIAAHREYLFTQPPSAGEAERLAREFGGSFYGHDNFDIDVHVFPHRVDLMGDPVEWRVDVRCSDEARS